MRFKSPQTDGFQAFAVSGVNTISFAISATPDAKKGLLGFAVERGLKGKGPSFSPASRCSAPCTAPDKDTRVSTKDHPVQSFVWDDFTAAPEVSTCTASTRSVARRKTRPTAAPVEIRVRTEPLFSDLEHDVFFNRGVASSQAYARKFGNRRPDDPKLPERSGPRCGSG